MFKAIRNLFKKEKNVTQRQGVNPAELIDDLQEKLKQQARDIYSDAAKKGKPVPTKKEVAALLQETIDNRVADMKHEEQKLRHESHRLRFELNKPLSPQFQQLIKKMRNDPDYKM